jgi:hypothetical protein
LAVGRRGRGGGGGGWRFGGRGWEGRGEVGCMIGRIGRRHEIRVRALEVGGRG